MKNSSWLMVKIFAFQLDFKGFKNISDFLSKVNTSIYIRRLI